MTASARLASLLVAGFALFAVAARGTADDSEPAAGRKTPSDSKEHLKAADIPPSSLLIPKGANTKQLLSYIRRIAELEPEFENETEALKFLSTTRSRIIAAADQVLAAQPSPDEEQQAIRAKLEAYQVLVVAKVPNVLPTALKFADGLRRDHRAAVAEMGQAAWLDFRMSAVPKADERERRSVVEAVAQSLRKKPQTFFEFARQLGMMLEFIGDGATAAFAYETFGEILSNNLDPQLHVIGEKMKVGAVRRARLLTGDPIKITGTTVDGQPFNIKQYKGKVVVVDFWATWCGPCLAELPNLKSVYEKYHDRGLEVVGISLDDDREELGKFLKVNEFPWKILLSTDPQHKGMDDANADFYGISGIPAVFLIDRDGKVVSLAARGEKLRELAAKLLPATSAQR